GDQVAVDFHDMQVIQPFQQRFGQCAEAGADFDDRVAALRADGFDDAGDDAVVDQEVLAESLARNVPGTCASVHALRRWRARSAASSTAATRLSQLALPVPASSSAVP